MPAGGKAGPSPGVSQTFARLVFAVTIAFFGAFFAWPLGQILAGGVRDPGGSFTLRYFGALLADPIYREGLLNALLVALSTTSLSLGMGVPLAWALERVRFPGRTLFSGLLLVPLILPPFVGAIGLKQMFGQYGAFNALLHRLGFLPAHETIDWFGRHPFWGVVLVQTLSLYPIILVNVSSSIANLDPALDEAAQNLGLSTWRRCTRIILPLIRPGMFAGGTVVFIWSLTELGTPLVFDFARITSVQVYEGLKDVGANPFPYALVTLMLFTSVACYAMGRGLFGRNFATGANKGAGRFSAGETSRTTARACSLACAAIVAAALLPHVGVVLVAFSRDWYGTVVPEQWTLENFHAALSHPLTLPSIANSLRFATAATAFDLVLGVAIAYVIARTPSSAGRLLDFMSMLPLAVPGLVLAFGYQAMAQEGKLFGFLHPGSNPTLLLIIAYSIRRLPYVVRAAAAGFQQANSTLEEAAQSLGCPPVRSIVRVILPAIWPHLAAGALLAFSFAVLEVADSLVLAQKQAYYPVTKSILELLQLLGDGKFIASALGTWAMAFLGATFLLLVMGLGRRINAIFRL